MYKFFLFLIILGSFLNADDKVEVYATSMDTKNNIVEARGEVVVIYQDYHLIILHIHYRLIIIDVHYILDTKLHFFYQV